MSSTMASKVLMFLDKRFEGHRWKAVTLGDVSSNGLVIMGGDAVPVGADGSWGRHFYTDDVWRLESPLRQPLWQEV